LNPNTPCRSALAHPILSCPSRTEVCTATCTRHGMPLMPMLASPSTRTPPGTSSRVLHLEAAPAPPAHTNKQTIPVNRLLPVDWRPPMHQVSPAAPAPRAPVSLSRASTYPDRSPSFSSSDCSSRGSAGNIDNATIQHNMPLREYSRDRIERPSPFRPTDRRISTLAQLSSRIVCHARASSRARVRVRGVPARACVRVARHAQTWRSAERSSTWPSDSPRSLRGLGRLHDAHVAELKCRLLPAKEQVAGPGADVAGVGPVPVQMWQG
jgi:hypothetical protein